MIEGNHVNRPSFVVALVALLIAAGGADPPAGRAIHVDPALGSDRANGLAPRPRAGDGPVKTIARGLKLAGPGDTVHLAPAVYHESALFHNRHGEPGHPITLDGHGATLEGSDPLQPADWPQVAPGLYRNDHLLRPDLLTRDDALIRRWFFVFHGRINHMGRTMKGPSRPLKKPADLSPGEWTIVADEHAFYVRIDPSRSLDDCKIAAPVRGAAVALGGDCAHIVVRNITGKHVYNDGYNIHGKTRDVSFEDIAAIECGDDGFSAHDDCAVRVDGFTSIGNSTGIANAGHSTSENRRVRIEDCLGVDLLFLDEGTRVSDENARHTIADSVIVSSAFRCLMIDGARGVAGPCRVTLDNVLIRRAARPDEIRVSKNSSLTANRVTLLGLRLASTGGTIDLRHSIIAGAPAPEIVLGPGTTWNADHNRYDLKSLRVDATAYTADTFVEYRRATGQDGQSRWDRLPIENGMLRDADPGVGVDASRLPRQ